jgi:hypothetical protein
VGQILNKFTYLLLVFRIPFLKFLNRTPSLSVYYSQLTTQLKLGKILTKKKNLPRTWLTALLCYCRETEKKTVWDQAFRDRCLNDSTNFSTPLFEKLLQLSLDCAVALLCSPTLPVILLTDTLDILPLVKCEEIFNMVENRVSIWKKGLFFNLCKDILLRLCNGR